jgi:hypothetical protein
MPIDHHSAVQKSNGTCFERLDSYFYVNQLQRKVACIKKCDLSREFNISVLQSFQDVT